MKILRLLRILGKNDTDASETMNDILAQVCIPLTFYEDGRVSFIPCSVTGVLMMDNFHFIFLTLFRSLPTPTPVKM